MRHRSLALATLLSAGILSAQSDNVLENFSGRANASTRSAMPGSDNGDVCQRFDSSLLSCIAQYESVGGPLVHRFNGWRVFLQDEVASTAEQFTLALIDDDPLAPGTPDMNADLLRTPALATPTAGAVPTAWMVTVTLSTPFDTVPIAHDVHVAVGLPANPSWPSDGLSIHESGWTVDPADNPFLTGLDPIPDCVTTIDRTLPGQPIAFFDNTHFQRIGMLTPGALLAVGADVDPQAQVCPNPNFGAAGRYPDQNPGRLDGIAFRVTDANHPSTSFAVLGNFGPKALSPLSGGPGVRGQVCLDLAALLPVVFAAGSTDAQGDATALALGFPNGWGFGIGEMHFQGLLLEAGGAIALTQGAGFVAQ